MSVFKNKNSGSILFQANGDYFKRYFRDGQWIDGPSCDNSWIIASGSDDFEEFASLEEAMNPKVEVSKEKVAEAPVPAEEPEPKVEGPKKGK